MVTLHHGTISVSSEEGKGTSFVVILPIADYIRGSSFEENVSIHRRRRCRIRIRRQWQHDRKPLILAVEDNEDIRDHIRRRLPIFTT